MSTHSNVVAAFAGSLLIAGTLAFPVAADAGSDLGVSPSSTVEVKFRGLQFDFVNRLSEIKFSNAGDDKAFGRGDPAFGVASLFMNAIADRLKDPERSKDAFLGNGFNANNTVQYKAIVPSTAHSNIPVPICVEVKFGGSENWKQLAMFEIDPTFSNIVRISDVAQVSTDPGSTVTPCAKALAQHFKQKIAAKGAPIASVAR